MSSITAENAPIHMDKVEGHVISQDHQFVIQGPLEQREMVCVTCMFAPSSNRNPYDLAAIRYTERRGRTLQ